MPTIVKPFAVAQAEGFVCEGYKANVLDPEELNAVHAQVLKELGSCDILVNGAGGNNPRATTDNEYQHEAENIEDCKTFFDLDAGGVDFVFRLNFQGTLLPTQAFAKDMVEKSSGCILNISSMNAYIPLTKIPAYSGAKAAVSNFTQWLATHFAGSGIRCNAIAPGFLVTNQNRALLFNADVRQRPVLLRSWKAHLLTALWTVRSCWALHSFCVTIKRPVPLPAWFCLWTQVFPLILAYNKLCP